MSDDITPYTQEHLDADVARLRVLIDDALASSTELRSLVFRIADTAREGLRDSERLDACDGASSQDFSDIVTDWHNGFRLREAIDACQALLPTPDALSGAARGDAAERNAEEWLIDKLAAARRAVPPSDADRAMLLEAYQAIHSCDGRCGRVHKKLNAYLAGRAVPETPEPHAHEFDTALPGGWMGCGCGATQEPRREPTGQVSK